MANQVEQITLGVDVSKDELVVFNWNSKDLSKLSNEPATIRAWLRTLQGPVRIAIEPTSSYHLAFVEQAMARGCSVYLVNPRQLAHYREAVNERNKTDPDDAYLLARYLNNEASQLRAYEPLDPKAQRLWTLLKRRAVVVDARKQLRQSLAEAQLPSQALFTQFRHVLARIDARIDKLIGQLGWSDDYQRCLSVPGFGRLNAAALVCAYRRGAFASSDAFVAFLGLDIRVRDSGQFKGKRKLTKRGESELRRLLYCATKPARTYPPFDRYRQRQLDKGLPKIAANVILARKLARIAFALLRDQTTFRKQPMEACPTP
ncbi:MAG: IS110 family transposase [Gammaproteobacteria bacterium]|nr:IS110 family transposase [Gammaproteobacteria bacterium]